MTAFFIITLMAIYAGCALARFGGHYIHVLPTLAMGIYLYGLFTGKSAGVGSE